MFTWQIIQSLHNHKVKDSNNVQETLRISQVKVMEDLLIKEAAKVIQFDKGYGYERIKNTYHEDQT